MPEVGRYKCTIQMFAKMLELFRMLKRIFGILLSGLLVSGCAINSDLTISPEGSVSGTAGFAILKAAFPKVTNLDQWTAILSQNNVTSPTPDPSSSALPSGPICAPGEDLIKGQWTYSCELVGADVSLLTGQVSTFSNLKFVRSGDNLEISTRSTSSSTDLPLPVDSLGIKGLSLIEFNSSITVPGVCTSSSSNGVVIEAGSSPNTQKVTFNSASDASDTLSASCVLDSLVSAPVSSAVTLSVLPGDDTNGAGVGQIILTALVTPAAAGDVEFFDGETNLGKISIEDGQATLVVSGESGSHEFRAEFVPTDWWSHDSGAIRRTVSLKSFSIKSKPMVKGFNKPGVILRVKGGSVTPRPTKISYLWLRNGFPIQGASKSTYKVTSRDRGKRLSVQLTYKGADTLGKFIVVAVKAK